MIRKPRAAVILTIVVAAMMLGGVAVPLTNHPGFLRKLSYDQAFLRDVEGFDA